ncbi:hypothetical protein GBA52_025466 [Prunus armeniaca]|nr:hypothetical protein GBA52_025466 [Prunus armeniaca]
MQSTRSQSTELVILETYKGRLHFLGGMIDKRVMAYRSDLRTSSNTKPSQNLNATMQRLLCPACT